MFGASGFVVVGRLAFFVGSNAGALTTTMGFWAPFYGISIIKKTLSLYKNNIGNSLGSYIIGDSFAGHETRAA